MKRNTVTEQQETDSVTPRNAHCLTKRDFSEIKLFSDDKRCHVMKALSALSKFLGIYDEFKRLVRNYGLKWTSRNGDDLIIARLTKSVNGDEIIGWIKEVKKQVSEHSTFMDFMAAIGLRYNEAIHSWNLIIKLNKENKLEEYYKVENEVLEYFRFKEHFIRRTKKAFASFVSKELIRKIAKSDLLTTNMIKKKISRFTE